MDAFTQEMKELLLKEKQEIINKLKEDEDEIRLGLNSDGDDVDIANEADSLKTREIFNQMDSKRLKAIDNALKRINDNRYGYCLQCGKKIPEGRLRAMPSAVLCITCKEMQERYKAG